MHLYIIIIFIYLQSRGGKPKQNQPPTENGYKEPK